MPKKPVDKTEKDKAKNASAPENNEVSLKPTTDASVDVSEEPSGSKDNQFSMADLNNLAAMTAEIERLQLQSSGSGVRDLETAKHKNFAFWNTQPVPKFDEELENQNEPIEPDVSVSQIRQEPYSLPDAFEWSEVDLLNETELKELYTLLTENYVEDDDNMFRFDYSPQFLQWALLVPGWLKTWHCGVRAKSNKKLYAFISAIPQTIHVYDKERKMVEINFLCVHKKLRSKRVAPVLIREITRRVNVQGIFQAAYTAGIVIPKPVGICRYYHRSLNPKKLIECKFSHLGPKMTLARTIKLYKLPDTVQTEGFRPLQKKDVAATWQLLSAHLKQYKLAPVFSKKEFEHIFLPREDVVYTFVVENGGKITDMVSFYSLPSSVMANPNHKTIRAAYSYYCVPGSVPLKQLLNDALIIANQIGFDVFNALDLMDNKEVLEQLKFGIGDGNLQYYLYNWRCPSMEPKDIGLILQ